jgi:hypothetical protein
MAKEIKMGRPPVYTRKTRVTLHSTTGSAKLQENGDRMAVVKLLVANRGSLTLGEIDLHFGYDVLPVVLALSRCGWVDLGPTK